MPSAGLRGCVSIHRYKPLPAGAAACKHSETRIGYEPLLAVVDYFYIIILHNRTNIIIIENIANP